MEFDFSTAATVESLDTVPEAFRGAYAEATEGGGFVIADSAKGLVDAVIGLNSAVKNERKNTETAKAKLTEFKPWQELGESPDAVKESIAELQKQIEASSDGKVNLDKMKADMERASAATILAKDAEVEGMRGSLNKYMVETQATRELADAKGAVDLLLPHVMGRAKVVQDGENYTVRVFDEAGDPRGDGKGGFMGVKELVAEMKNSPTFGRAFEASGNKGSGANPNGANRNVDRKSSQQLTPTERIKAGLESRA
tara:strand:- start:4916 stop:5680 length:765 start_codon:yes stop_codon:yes gene_type:complete